MNNQQSLGGGARGFLPLKGKIKIAIFIDEIPTTLKIAFTLEEVLITLGIIGVVAAMTLPTLIQKQNEKKDIVHLKKVYSILNQALLKEISENGTVDLWGLTKTDTGMKDDEGLVILDNSGREKLASIFKKHLKVVVQPDISFESIPIYNMGGIQNMAEAQDYSIKNTLYLADGTIIKFGYIRSCIDWCADIAVYLKSSNGKYIQGRNTFYFHLDKDKIYPAGMQNATVYSFEATCKYGNTERQNGRGCTAWVIFNENMDYLRCADLSWGGKHSCR